MIDVLDETETLGHVQHLGRHVMPFILESLRGQINHRAHVGLTVLDEIGREQRGMRGSVISRLAIFAELLYRVLDEERRELPPR
jgi:hypothetical protein